MVCVRIGLWCTESRLLDGVYGRNNSIDVAHIGSELLDHVDLQRLNRP